MTVENQIVAAFNVCGIVIYIFGHVAALFGVDEETGVESLACNRVERGIVVFLINSVIVDRLVIFKTIEVCRQCAAIGPQSSDKPQGFWVVLFGDDWVRFWQVQAIHNNY